MTKHISPQDAAILELHDSTSVKSESIDVTSKFLNPKETTSQFNLENTGDENHNLEIIP